MKTMYDSSSGLQMYKPSASQVYRQVGKTVSMKPVSDGMLKKIM